MTGEKPGGTGHIFVNIGLSAGTVNTFEMLATIGYKRICLEL